MASDQSLHCSLISRKRGGRLKFVNSVILVSLEKNTLRVRFESVKNRNRAYELRKDYQRQIMQFIGLTPDRRQSKTLLKIYERGSKNR